MTFSRTANGRKFTEVHFKVWNTWFVIGPTEFILHARPGGTAANLFQKPPENQVVAAYAATLFQKPPPEATLAADNFWKLD